MKLGSQIDFWNKFKKLGEPEDVQLYRLAGRVETGGYSTDFYEDEPEQIEAVIRPWQQDMPTYREEGQTGQTPGFKLYVPASLGLARNDRIHWDSDYWDGHQPFRVANPQHDQLADLERFDMLTDEREFVTESEISVDEEDIERPDRPRSITES